MRGMRIILRGIVITLFFIIYCCSFEDAVFNDVIFYSLENELEVKEYSESRAIESEELNEKKLNFQKFIDNGLIGVRGEKFQILVSRSESKKYNITSDMYDFVDSEIRKLNKLLDSIIAYHKAKEPDLKVVVNNLTNDNVSENNLTNLSSIERLTNSELPPAIMPSGVISTTDQNYGYDYCFAPMGMKQIRANCYATIFGSHIVTTKTLGSLVASPRFSGGEVTVGLSFSNIDCTIGYATTDSFGGRCVWNGER